MCIKIHMIAVKAVLVCSIFEKCFSEKANSKKHTEVINQSNGQPYKNASIFLAFGISNIMVDKFITSKLL